VADAEDDAASLRHPGGSLKATRGVAEDQMMAVAVAGNPLLSSIVLVVILFVGLGVLFGHRWRTGAVAVVAVVALNVFYAGGAPRVMANILRPFHTLATYRHPPEPPVEKPAPWPP
jgi:hypothetical protein